MTGTDPAILAAERWWAKQGNTEQEREDSVDCASDVAKGAAREALAPIRELHKPGYGWKLPRRPNDRPVTYCVHCEADWPCDTARLIYTSEELNHA